MQRLQDLERLSSDWFWETDADLQLAFVSHRVFDTLSILPVELEGRPLDSLLEFDDQNDAARVLAERRPFRDLACHAVSRDGEVRAVLVSAVPIFATDTGEFVGFRGSASDVTAQRKSEQAVARRDAILASVGGTARHLILDDDHRTDVASVLAKFGSASAADRVQLFAVSQVPEDPVWLAKRTAIWVSDRITCFHADRGDRGIPLRAFGRGDWEARLAQGETVVVPPGRWRRGDEGCEHPVSVLLAAPVFVSESWWGFLLFDRWTVPERWTLPEIEAVRIAAGLLGGALYRDLYRRRLGESRALLHAAFHTCPDAVAVIRLRDGVVLDANKRFLDGCGRERGDVVEQSLSKTVDVIDPGNMAALTRMLVVRREVRGIDVSVRGRGGEVNTASVSARVVMIDGAACALVVARDVTLDRRTAQTVRTLSQAIEQSPALVLISDAAGMIEYVNQRFADTTGFLRDAVIGASLDNLTSIAGHRVLATGTWSEVLNGRTRQQEFPIRRSDGTTVWVRQSLSPIRSDTGFVTHVLAVGEDLSEQRWYEERLVRQARRDPLTDLPNRTAFFRQLTTELAEARKHHETVALLFIDIDRFKFINESHGPAGGDLVLRETAQRLAAWAGPEQLVARIAGDEFSLLLHDSNDRSRVAAAVPEIQELLARPFEIAGDQVHVHASIGIACFPEDGEDEYALLQCADAAVRGAKTTGGNTYRFFRAEMTVRAHAVAKYSQDLSRALPERQLSVYYQPVIDLRTDRVVAAESLLRWRHPRFGLVAPTEFIGLAEESGLIEPIGEWILMEACRQAKTWLEEGLGLERISVNVSSLQLQRGRLLASVFSALSASGLPAAHLAVEITESAFLADVDEAKRTLEKLQTMGITISVDDFGTGYASLTYLRSLPLRNLKIDRSFIEDVTTNADAEAIVDAVLAMARRLNLETIAEGVARADQLALLRAKKCEQVQGFFFSEPLPAEAFRDYVRSRSPGPFESSRDSEPGARSGS